MEKTFTPHSHPLPRVFEGKEYYGAEDVAKIIGVDRTTVLNWQKKGIFTADTRAHDGRYLYEVERVMQLKSVYHPNWTRGGYEEAPAEIKRSSNKSAPVDDDIERVKFMTPADQSRLGDEINATHPHQVFTAANKKSSNEDKCYIICPKCGNGTGKDGTPLELKRKNGRWLYYCHVCNNIEGTLLQIIAAEENLNLKNYDDRCKALAIGANLCGYPLPESKDQKYFRLVQKDIREAQAHINELPEDQRRGLGEATLKHFGFGYLTEWKHPSILLKGEDMPASRRIIIPTPNHYNAVALPADRAKMDKGYWKMHTQPKELFNAPALVEDKKEIVVTEGEIDAASIWQAFKGEISVVASGAVSAWQKTLLPRLRDVDEGKNFLILFDAEKTSREQAEKLCNELIARGFPAACRFYYDALSTEDKLHFGEKVDANQILQERGNFFLQDLTQQIIDDALKDFAEAEKIIAKNADTRAKAAARAKDIEEWESFNGKIKPDMLSELVDAAEYLKTFTAFTIDQKNAQSPKTKNALAICKFYTPYAEEADNFFVTFDAAKKSAKAALKTIRDECSDFADPPVAGLEALINLSTAKLREDVESLVKDFKKNHKTWRKEEQKRLAHEQAERRREERSNRLADIQLRLDSLRNEKPNPERDDELIELIKKSCEWKLDAQRQPVEIKATAANADKIFTYDPTLDGLHGFDEFQQATVFLKAPAWNPKINFGDEWTDADDAQLRLYLRRTYAEFNNQHLVEDLTTDYAKKRSFHEVKDFFNNLPEWDGTPRAESLFIDFLGAKDTPFVREVTMNWLTAAVARIFYPGCDYQLAPILLGGQGIGKTLTLKRLGGKWYGSLVDDMGDSHALDAIQVIWLCEVKEMTSMKKDVDANKSFIDSAIDKRRRAYEKRPSTVKRHCVFAITTNNRMCLADMTGNRRYPVIECLAKDSTAMAALTADYVRQLWAEVFAHFNELFEDGFDNAKLELSMEAKLEVNATAEQFTRDDISGDIKSFLDTKIPPEIIWRELTREERRKFIAEGSLQLVDGECDLNKRIRARYGKNAQKFVNKLDVCLNGEFSPGERVRKANEHINRYNIKRGEDTVEVLKIYGSEDRMHICPAEIYQEAFDRGDRRKSYPKILESLNRLDGWAQGTPLYRTDPAYNDQRVAFYRIDADNEEA